MANNNDNNERMHQELVDPLRFVPNETFSKLISFLPPSSIASSSATCTKWREVIHSDTTLHREIDLSKMGVESNPARIILHLNRLSSLALNQVVKISLNLSSFFETFEADPRGAGFKNIFHLTKALQQTKDTLRELAFQVHLRDPHNKDHHAHPPQMVHFLLLPLRPLGKGSFIRLVRVQIKAPVGVIARAGDAIGLPGSREVFLNGKDGKLQSKLSELTQEMTHLAGSGFKEFEFGYVLDSSLLQCMSQMSEDNSQLQHLDIGNCNVFTAKENSLAMWDFSMTCQKLTSLKIRLLKNGSTDIKSLAVPQEGARQVQLSSLNFCMSNSGFIINIRHFGRWVGNVLEDLRIRFIPDDTPLREGIFSSVVMPSRETLKSVELSVVGCGEDEISSLDASSQNFPHLESLSLRSVSIKLFDFFSDVKADRLHKIYLSAATSATELQACTTCLIKLLKEYDTRITSLGFDHSKKFPFLSPSENLSFSFTKVEVLDLPLNSTDFEEWLSSFYFPSLKRFFWGINVHPKFNRANAPLLVD